jgi:engulfment/cell motility protein 1
MQEQRIRCLLQGAWFPSMSSDSPTLASRSSSPFATPASPISSWRFVQLSPSRRHLHYSSHSKKLETKPALADMSQRLDVNNISSVVSSVTATDLPPEISADKSANAPLSPRARQNGFTKATTTVTKLDIHGSRSTNTASSSPSPSVDTDDPVLLELHTASSVLASEWLDGLLMLLNQKPITADTNRLIDVIENWSLKVRMLNLQWEDVDFEGGNEGPDGSREWEAKIPSREGLDADYWYEMG